MKKLLTVIACASLVCGSAAAESPTVSISFSNELGSDVVNITKNKTVFAGFYDEAKTDIVSEKVDAGIDAKFVMTTDENGKPGSLSWNSEDSDWYLTFRPVQAASLGFSTDFFMEGSYLVIEDKNISGGRLGSDGFTAAFTGVKNLIIAATVPFGYDSENNRNWFTTTYTEADGTETTRYLNAGFGASYTFDDKGSVGAVIHDVANNRTRGFGVYGSAHPAEGVAVYAGYAFNDTEGLCDVADTEGADDSLVNASVSFKKSAFGCSADYITTVKDDALFYAAADFSYDVTDKITVELGGTVHAAYRSTADGMYVVKPAVTYTPGEIGEFKVESDIAFTGKEFDSIKFPVYWKYSF